MPSKRGKALIGRRDQEVAADTHTQFIDAVQELGQEGMQPGGQDFVDAGVLQVRQQLAGAALGFCRLVIGHLGQVADHLDQAGMK